MELTDFECGFICTYRTAKRDHDTSMLICIVALLDVLSKHNGVSPSGLLSGFTKGEYKRAIKTMRASESNALRENRLELAEDYDSVVRYIRESCLNCHVGGGKKIA